MIIVYLASITDGEKAYKNYAEKNDNITLKQAKGGRVINDKYHIQTINSFHSGLKEWIKRFRGVATKHLDSYLNFYRAAKAYSVEQIFELCIELGICTRVADINSKTMNLT